MKQAMEYLQSALVITLVLAGLGGIAYNAVREGGWISSFTGNILSAYFRNPMVAIPLTIVAIGVGYYLRKVELSKGRNSKVPTYLMYVLMIAGAYFIVHYIYTGQL